MEQQSEQNVQTSAVSVGSALRAAREAAGLSLGEVAERLKLSMRQLDAIENDNFDALPGATFVRGFVRNYARFLEIDPAPLMTALDGHFPSAATEVANLSREERHHESDAEVVRGDGKSAPWMVMLLVGAVTAAVVYWIYSGTESHETQQEASVPMSAASEPAASASFSEASQPAIASAPALVPPAEHVAASAPTVASAAVAARPAASAPAVRVEASSSASTGQAGKVAVSVSEEAWVSITDATGKRLVYSTVRPGESREVSGQAPFRVVLGNAGKVTINYNGQPVDFSDRIRNTTAKIELR
ncbi:RodZ domain-containing protein [Paludibacterium paludis]|uniref:Cytoskeleton protein RodZ n=1 Tax=Paludibacterium paludis TaxID=1225769 RepID=A0A918NY43_9NEIS|nr:RodZ domain-containing protein [Paludibacterium paludis]GGY05396.1 cytoskeleton protein RodZ [Paludibacterium paludis]